MTSGSVKYSCVLVIATLSLLAASCGDKSPTDPIDGDVSGTVSFTYAGGVGGGGSYSAIGAIGSSVSATTAHTATWAAGWKDNSDNSTNVLANMPRTDGLSDVPAITINRQTAGAATINPNCIPTSTTSCNDVFFFIGADATGSSFTYLCTLTSGAITILSISSIKVTGTFSGAGSCLHASSGTTSAFAVTSGSFDVPLLANIPVGF